eukprot:TRINITY_DN88549_c0_g1_i1.p1 TRINITY_DN88549_c0_g1~~TRINITY_DN88549_c0_g1_i1.p1  ORF type:complete len:728 (+),score=174.66 TRINITY_DN88549_c0_g1_i1:62-2185(+)
MAKLHEDCKARFSQLEQELKAFSEAWHDLEVRLEGAAEHLLQSRLPSWQKWFELDEEELGNWNLGGLRWMAQHRIHQLLLSGLVSRMSSRVGLTADSKDETPLPVATRRSCNHVLDALIDYFEARVKAAFAEAQKEDNNLMKKIRKTGKDEKAAGIVALGMGDTKKVSALKRQRPALWEEAQKVLDKFTPPVKAMTAFAVEELTEAPLTRMVGAAAGVTFRAVCDWIFQKSCADQDQLEKWWGSTKDGLQAKEQMWQCLVEKEGMLLKRIEKGLEDAATQRQRYVTYANFGGNAVEVVNLIAGYDPAIEPGCLPPHLERPGKLLATTASGMHKQLRMIRDSALWRVVDSAQEIHRQLSQSVEAEPPAWQSCRSEDGLELLLGAICEPDSSSASSGYGGTEGTAEEDLSDALLKVMHRLDGLLTTFTEIKDYFQGMSGPTLSNALTALDTSDVCQLLASFLQNVAILNEDLLVVLDDLEVEAVKGWLQQFEHLLGETGMGLQLNQKMEQLPLQKDSRIKPDARRQRRKYLTLVRGLHLLLEDRSLRRSVIEPLSRQLGDYEPQPPAPPAQAVEEEPGLTIQTAGASELEEDADQELDVAKLEVPPSPLPISPSSGGFTFSPARRRAPWPQVKAEPATASPEAATADAGLAVNGMSSPAKSPHAMEPRPPPPRSETPAQDESGADAKFLNEQFVTLSPSSSRRLKPLKK